MQAALKDPVSARRRFALHCAGITEQRLAKQSPAPACPFCRAELTGEPDKVGNRQPLGAFGRIDACPSEERQSSAPSDPRLERSILRR